MPTTKFAPSSRTRAAAAALLTVLGGCDAPGITSTAGQDGGPAALPGAANPDGRPSTAPLSPIPATTSRPADAASSPPLTATGENCGVSTHGLNRLPAEVLLVLDRSGSMIENRAAGAVCSTRACGTRWAETTAALKTALERTESNVAWGLKLYPEDAYCGVGPGASVPVAPSNAAAIVARYGQMPPIADAGFTPTRDAMVRAGEYLRARTTPNPRYVLLATDGEPNCAVSGRGNKDGAASIQAVADVAAAGTPVFVVGMATAGSPAHAVLNEMAVKGGRPRNDPTTQYYAVDTSEDLVAALTVIGGQLASCTFALDRVPPVPSNVAVDADGVRVRRDPGRAEGWEYGPGMNTIQLYGEVCARVMSGAVKSVQMIFGCPGVVIP